MAGSSAPTRARLAAHLARRELTEEERAQVAALAVAWWDGVLTALRAAELLRGRRER